MPKPRFVQISKDGMTAEVVTSAVHAWERNGWTVVDDESSEVQIPEPVVIEVGEPEYTIDPQPALTDENKE